MVDGLFERHVWVLWYQGLDRASEGVRRCIERWSEANPGWEVTVLSDENLGHWVSADLLNDPRLKWLSPTNFSDLIRLDLLSRCGGVWVDATCWCVEPLDAWIDRCIEPSGFFAFSWIDSPSGFFTFHKAETGGFQINALISSWFLAAVKGHVLVDGLYRDLRDYWAKHRFVNDDRRLLRLLLDGLLTRNDRVAQWYLSPLVANVLRVSPYFAFHYCFTRLVTRDRLCRAAWDRTPKISALEPLLPQVLGLRSPATGAAVVALQESTAPVFKLSWRGPFEPGSVFDLVTSATEAEPTGGDDQQPPNVVDEG